MPIDKKEKIEKILNAPTLNLLTSVNLKTVDKVSDPDRSIELLFI